MSELLQAGDSARAELLRVSCNQWQWDIYLVIIRTILKAGLIKTPSYSIKVSCIVDCVSYKVDLIKPTI